MPAPDHLRAPESELHDTDCPSVPASVAAARFFPDRAIGSLSHPVFLTGQGEQPTAERLAVSRVRFVAHGSGVAP